MAAALSHSSSSPAATSTSQGGRSISSSWTRAFSRSRVTRNSVPLSCSLSTSMEPCMASMMYLVMAMPRPEPSVFWTRRSSSREKESKMCSLNSGDMPMPVSFTRRWTRTQPSPLGEGSS